MKKDEMNQNTIDAYDYLSNAASTTDCTGLIPSLPESGDEWEAYDDIFHFKPIPFIDKTGEKKQ